jgi:hypothetical protein
MYMYQKDDLTNRGSELTLRVRHIINFRAEYLNRGQMSAPFIQTITSLL